MPMPKPRADENESDWMDRCMADPTMNDEFPDNDQRAAVCHQIWRDRSEDVNDAKRWLEGAISKSGEKEGAQPVYQAWASTGAVDRHGEIVAPRSFANLSDYVAKNPVIFYDHAWATWDAPSPGSLPIGKAISARVVRREAGDAEGLRLSWVFSELPFAQDVKYLVDVGVLNSMSIGFRPLKWDHDEDGRRVYTQVELLEVSVVGIPANQEAEIIRAASARDVEQVRAVYERIKGEMTPEPTAAAAGRTEVKRTGGFYHNFRQSMHGRGHG